MVRCSGLGGCFEVGNKLAADGCQLSFCSDVPDEERLENSDLIKLLLPHHRAQTVMRSGVVAGHFRAVEFLSSESE